MSTARRASWRLIKRPQIVATLNISWKALSRRRSERTHGKCSAGVRSFFRRQETVAVWVTPLQCEDCGSTHMPTFVEEHAYGNEPSSKRRNRWNSGKIVVTSCRSPFFAARPGSLPRQHRSRQCAGFKRSDPCSDDSFHPAGTRQLQPDRRSAQNHQCLGQDIKPRLLQRIPGAIQPARLAVRLGTGLPRTGHSNSPGDSTWFDARLLVYFLRYGAPV